MANEFLVSVADSILRDPVTGNALAYGKTNITSAFTLSTKLSLTPTLIAVAGVKV